MNIISYKQINFWNNSIPLLLPNKARITREIVLSEYYWHWRGNEIHIDNYSNENAPAKIIILHGLGMNGRLNSFIAVPLWKAGYDVISPDLPFFGLSKNRNKEMIYDDWVELVKDLIIHELNVDDKPIIIIGLGTNGMLAYQAASVTKVAGIILTHVLDPSKLKIRMATANNKIAGLLALPFSSLLSPVEPDVYIPLNLVINLRKQISDEALFASLLGDEYSFSTDINLRFLNSILKSKLEIEPEYFSRCPLVLIHPELDQWTSLEHSKLFFDRLSCDKKIVILKGAGHLPIEDYSITQLEEEIINFIENTTNRVCINE